MALRLYNTLTRRLEEFIPLEPGQVKMYCCGPTVYDYVGLHNAKTLVTFDVIRRVLEYRGYRVTFAQNITDIDDKIIQRAAASNADAMTWAKTFTEAYREDILRAGARPPDIAPQASNTIVEIQMLIQRLLAKGAAYETRGGVYYRVEAFPEYGKLSGRTPEDVRAGARVEVDEEKDDPRDFALWKRAKIGEPWWESPWGPGRPGWHIECSAMVMKHLGETIDIHAGGADLVFPHHENEVAQSETATGKPFARYWLHGGLLRTGGRRMGKSEGNMIRLRDALDRYPVEAVRLYLLSAHYRKPLEYNEGVIEEHIPPARRLNQCLNGLRAFARDALPFDTSESETAPDTVLPFLLDVREANRRFVEEMDDDFNVPGALGVVFESVTKANRFLAERMESSRDERRAVATALRFLDDVTDVLGLRAPEKSVAGVRLGAVLSAAIGLRAQARDTRNWALADRIRAELAHLGVVLRDARDGSAWELAQNVNADEVAQGVVETLLAMRREVRAQKDWALADALRDTLAEAGIALRDSRNGTDWDWTVASPREGPA